MQWSCCDLWQKVINISAPQLLRCTCNMNGPLQTLSAFWGTPSREYALYIPKHSRKRNLEDSEFCFLRGYCTLNLKLVCFLCYLKIIKTFFKKLCIYLKLNYQETEKCLHCEVLETDFYVMDQNSMTFW